MKHTEEIMALADAYASQLQVCNFDDADKARDALEAAVLAQGEQKPVAVFDEQLGRPCLVEGAPMLEHGQPLYTHPAHEAALAKQGEQEAFIKHEGDDDGWSEWVCPDPKSYLMKCCDCGLVHEAQFNVVRYKSATEREGCDVVDDPNLQAVFRMRRSAQWTPEDTAYRPGGLAQPEQEVVAWRTEVKYGKLFFHIGVQSFAIDYTPEDEPECSAGDAMAWMEKRLHEALSNLAGSHPAPEAKQEPVAWYLPQGTDDSLFRDHRTVVACTGNKWEEWIPLYTHPTPVNQPSVRVGHLHISRHPTSGIWLRHDNGEAMQTDEDKLYQHLSEYWHKEF